MHDIKPLQKVCFLKTEKNKRTITVFSIRVYPETGLANFRRNPEFSNAFQLFFMECFGFFDTLENCLEIKQISNTLVIVFQTDDSEKINAVFALLKNIENITTTLNEKFAQNMQPTSLKTAIALDCGETTVVFSSLDKEITSPILWLGDVLERAISISALAGTQRYPAVFITYAVYNNLQECYKKKFLRSYYFFHICCFGDIEKF